MTRVDLTERMKGGLFVSSMMGITTGEWVARYGEGADMVQIGALIADSVDRDHEARFLLPLDEDGMVEIFRGEVEAVRRVLGDVPIGLNAAPGDLDSAVTMARAFGRAGGDIFELNCHGQYARLFQRGLLRAMALPEHRKTMHDWLCALCEAPIPIVVKYNGTTDEVDFVELLESIADIDGLFGVHFNVKDKEAGLPNLDLVRGIRPCVPGQLFCSGFVKERVHVDDLLRAGADCVGIAQGLRDEPGIIRRIAGS